MKKRKIDIPQGIDEKIYVDINGQKQYIRIKGKDKNNPIILNLHGGPASPDTVLTYTFVNEMSDRYTYVSWEQRGCGRTYLKNKKIDSENKSANFEQAISDVDALVQYLCKRFKKEKIYLLGHSYGTLLGTSYIYAHPEKIEKYIGIGQTVSIIGTQTENYHEVSQQMGNDEKGLNKLTKAFETLQKDLTAENLMSFQRLTIPYYRILNNENSNQIKLILQSPELTFTDLRWLLSMLHMKKFFIRNKQLLAYTLTADIYSMGMDFKVPMIFISGEFDRSCSVNLTEQYCNMITAPSKIFVVLKKCGHSPQIEIPKKLAEEIKRLL